MKLKLTVLAAVLVASGAANAAINNGNNGNGELFFNAWDGTQSYTRDLNLSQDAFEAALAAPGSFSQSWSGDALFSTFLSTANLATLQWNIFSTETAGARRIMTTFNGVNFGNKGNDVIRSSAAGVQAFLNGANTALAGADSYISSSNTAAAYAGRSNSPVNKNGANLLGYVTTGDASNNSFATGIGFQRVDALATGIAKSTYTPYADGGTDMRVYLNGSTLTMQVAAVPEPETYAMLLAGLGLIGSIARRRARRAA